MMTVLTMVLGMLPLMVATGAGANGSRSLASCVIGGMLSATVLAIFFVPIFFVLVMRYFTKYKPRQKVASEEHSSEVIG